MQIQISAASNSHKSVAQITHVGTSAVSAHVHFSHSFIRSFIHPFNHSSFIHSFIHGFSFPKKLTRVRFYEEAKDTASGVIHYSCISYAGGGEDEIGLVSKQ